MKREQPTNKRDYNRRNRGQKVSNKDKELEFDHLKKKRTDNPFINEEPRTNNRTSRSTTDQRSRRDYSTKSQTESVKIQNNQKRPINNQPQSAGTLKDYKGIVYFKNGAKMNGIITEHSSGDVTIKLPGGSTIESKMKDIQKIDPQ